MCDFVGPILEVIKFIGRPAGKYLTYHRKFKDYVDGFKEVREDLQAREGDIRRQLHDEHRFGKKAKQEVESWFNKVEERLGHAQRVEDKVANGKYLFRSCLGKHIHETTLAIKEVYDEGNFSGSLVVNDPSATTPMLPVPELEGGSKVQEEIYNHLMGNEVGMIGVSGMGGIGKTTIMKHIYNRLSEENNFSKLIWTTVSQNFDIRRLQKSIADQLKEDLSTSEDLAIRAATLSEMLKRQGRYVAILDDVWSSFSLKDVGIPEPTVDNGCKIVLTTRSEAVVRSMGCRKVQVPCLPMDEALQLFLSKVGQDLLPNPTIESIVTECDGLPLAIVTVAGCMRGVSDPLVWENALNELRSYIRNFQDVEDKVFACLKFSYDHLQQIDRDCFLYCALYPEDHEIRKEEIIENWMDERLIEEMGSRKAMQGCGHSIIQKLEENCLLERVGDEGTHIKMHDVVRDMALHITRKRFLVKSGKQLEELPNEEEWNEDLEKVSLMFNSISTIPPDLHFSKFEKVTSLLLSHNLLAEIPESFFDNVPNLKTLDLSYNAHIAQLPNSISNLEKLTALLLHCCENVDNLPSLLKLKALKKLDLGGTAIREIPQGLEMLVNLRYLHLGYTQNLKEMPNGILSNLCRLQYLAIHPASTTAVEMNELNKLEIFEGRFSSVGDFIMYDGQRKRLHKHSFWVSGNYNVYDGSMDYSKKIGFEGIDMNTGNRFILPCDVQQLQLNYCKVMRSLNDINGWEDVTDLKECIIFGCEGLESVLLSKCRQLETLEYLKVSCLWDLKAIVGESSVATFSSLKILYLHELTTIKKLFSPKWVLHNLEEITVENCWKMEEIIASEEEEETGTIKLKYSLPKLRKLVLGGLPELERICSENGVIVCDSLQVMEISYCTNLKRIPLCLHPDLDKENPSLPPLKKIRMHPKEWWDWVEWDHPHAKNVLSPFLYHHHRGWKKAWMFNAIYK